eukprot:scaffold161082_cov27-Prasinocladus_malaysianus.AAC.1
MHGLLAPDPADRLGNGHGGVRGVKEHAFFRDVDWVSLISGALEPPESLAQRASVCDRLMSGSAFTPQSYSGDTSWLDSF